EKTEAHRVQEEDRRVRPQRARLAHPRTEPAVLEGRQKRHHLQAKFAASSMLPRPNEPGATGCADVIAAGAIRSATLRMKRMSVSYSTAFGRGALRFGMYSR